MMPLVRLWPWLLATIAIALVVHLAAVIMLPELIMSRLLNAAAQTGGYNSLHHGARVTANSRGVVRPSPDLLYSICPYDLSNGPLIVRARVPGGTYWSVSAFDANTDNYFVRDDREARDGAVGFILFASARAAAPFPKGIEKVYSPSIRGLVLFRTLINDDAKLAEIDSARRQASCETYRPDIH